MLKKFKVKHFLTLLLFTLFIIGIVLFLYAYLFPFVGVDGTESSLAESPYFFDYKFFRVETYDTTNFPIIESLLSSMKWGLISSVVSFICLVNIYVWYLLKKREIF